MTHSEEVSSLTLSISDAVGNQNQLLDQASHLRDMLRRELGVDARLPPAGDMPPEHARSAGALEVGTIVLALVPTVVPAVVELLKLWINARQGRQIVIKSGGTTVELDPAASTRDDIRRVVDILSNPQSKQ